MTGESAAKTAAQIAARKQTLRLERLTRHTAELLGQIPDMWAEMSMVRDRRASLGSHTQPASRPLIDVTLWDLAYGKNLWNWCLLIIDEMTSLDQDDLLADSPDARNPTIPAMCGFLSNHTAWIITYNDDFPGSIKRLHADYRHAAGIKLEIAYHCPQCGWKVEPQDHAAWFRCTGCTKTWTLAAEIDRLMANQDQVMTLGQIATKTGIPHPTLRRWAGKRFTPVGVKHGRPLYDLRVVQRAAERIRRTS